MMTAKESREGLLYSSFSGAGSFDEIQPELREVLDTAHREKASGILLDCTDLAADFTTVQRYSLGDDFASRCHCLNYYPRIATVGRPPVIDGFAVLVGRNRGMDARHFADRREALEWLRSR